MNTIYAKDFEDATNDEFNEKYRVCALPKGGSFKSLNTLKMSKESS
jgi:hypothetical protein